MTNSNNRSYLVSKGFELVGSWHSNSGKLTFSLGKTLAKRPVIYVFVDNHDQVLYIGRTVLDLEDAMNRIRRGNESQVTNHRIHNHLVDHLQKGNSAEILAYTNSKDHTDLVAFLDEFKSELLQHISPLWNLQ